MSFTRVLSRPSCPRWRCPLRVEEHRTRRRNRRAGAPGALSLVLHIEHPPLTDALPLGAHRAHRLRHCTSSRTQRTHPTPRRIPHARLAQYAVPALADRETDRILLIGVPNDATRRYSTCAGSNSTSICNLGSLCNTQMSSRYEVLTQREPARGGYSTSKGTSIPSRIGIRIGHRDRRGLSSALQLHFKV